MKHFEFWIKQQPVAVGRHSWVAVDQTSGKAIDIPQDGMHESVGRYPAIAEHLKSVHGVEIRLECIDGCDTMIRHDDGTSPWTFNCDEAIVVIHEIPRLVYSIGVRTA